MCSLTYRLNLKNTKVNTENIIALAIDPVEKIVIPLARNESDSQISWELLAPVHQSRDRQYQIFFVANPATRSLLNTVRSMLLGSAVEKVVEEEFARQGGRFNPLALEQVFRDRDWLVISFYHTLQADW